MQQSRNALAASYRKMPSAMQNKLKSNMGIRNADDFASHFHDKSDTQRGDMMRKVGKIESGDRSKILDHLSGRSDLDAKKTPSYGDWKQHYKEDMVKQSTHDEALKFKIVKNLKESGDARGASKFLEHVGKEQERFKQVMRKQSLQDRLRMESDNAYTFGASKLAVSGPGNAKKLDPNGKADNYNGTQAADNHKQQPPNNNNQFFAA